MKRQLFVTLLLLITTLPVYAEMESIAELCEQEICTHIWPKANPPAGWKHDEKASLHYNFNAFTPINTDFSNAESVIYANAIKRSTVPNDATLDAFIQSDINVFKKDSPGIEVVESPKLTTADGKFLPNYWFKPVGKGMWERVAYLEEGDYYIVFVISARSEKGIMQDATTYETFVKSYHEKP
jgi:hypothetical protein